MASQKRCPRCGLPVSFYREKNSGYQVYVYAVHYLGYQGGRKRVRECYLGPKHGYVYVSRLHEREGLRLRGLLDGNRVLDYLDAIIDYISSSEIDPGLRGEIVRRVERISRVLGVCG